MKIYSLFSKSLNRYNLPFFAEHDDDAIATVSKMITAQQDPSLICALDDLALCRVGYFDSSLENPVSTELAVMVLDDLHKKLPLPPTIKERIDKYYGGAIYA